MPKVVAEVVTILFAGWLGVSKTERHERHLRHLSSFDREEKMYLNQIKFHLSVGGVKHTKFFYLYQKKAGAKYINLTSFKKLQDSLQRRTRLN